MSGFTTTGSSVLTDIEGAPKGILFWRALTHWLGGLGIVILFITVLPYLGAGGKILFLRESTGPDPRGLFPRVKETVRSLYIVYIGLTALFTIALMAAGMNLFDALCHTFAALATGGYSTRQASVGAYHSLSIEIIIIVCILAGATNFALYIETLRGNWRAAFKDAEWRVFMCIFGVATLLCTLNLMGMELTVPEIQVSEKPRTLYAAPTALRNAAFQVATCMTDTGFVTADFDIWPYFSRAVLMVITILGGCAGSTSGGIKTIRVIMLAKMTHFWIARAFQPRRVRSLQINGEVVSDDVQRRVYAFFTMYVAWLAFGWLVMSLMGLPLDTALSSVIATMNNCGPGLEFVGPATDFHLVPAPGKLFLSLTMVVGRIEFVSVLALFLPSFWRRR
jgi:trk system potassium uptake protein TrkH